MKVKKQMLATMLILALSIAMLPEGKIGAAERGTTSVEVTFDNSVTVRGSSTIALYMASGSTSATYYNSAVTCKVSSTYRAVKSLTLDDYIATGSSESTSSAVVSFLCPDDFHSESISSDHEASYNGHNWNSHTDAVIYP